MKSTHYTKISLCLRSICEFFSEHPASVGETYFEHFRVAGYFSGQLAKAAAAAACHALFPATYTTTASSIIRKLHDRMVVNRAHQSPVQELPTDQQE